ncbi:PRC-barrel domain-containing protein [Anaeromyxobacter sp. Fw109-5]|uniref:PRC-barrel domain-containing protein n=1 Tax=Anaeromyxobacter sp. (strain Fw109-5) TaxID=404589 RepID=UPI0000ED89E9|nr:PRC-barrel domain-containing protein [Anaeromyxobacter sp. Fw109-5]ABS27521.1 PRC-barrel domain protein [Anaeromyxobacter sp. Fw109-5]
MKTRLALAVVGLALAPLALAQQDSQQGGGQTAPPVAGTIPLGTTVEETRAVAVGYRASKLIGAPVYNDKDQKIGKVDDLVVAPDGKVSLAVVDVGGFLGMGRHQVAIPVEQFSAVKPKVVLPGATKDALKQLPEFQYAKS